MILKSTWIAGTESFSDFEKSVNAPLLRACIGLEDEIQTAELTISALGFYDVFINGKRITKGILAPYICNPEHTVYYDNYDVTEHIVKGKNVVAIVLGNGLTNNFSGFCWGFDKASYRGAPKCAFSLEVNGKEVLSSADRVKTAPSALLRDDYKDGEIYDARLEIAGWNLSGFDDTKWKNAVTVSAPCGEPVLCTVEPIAEYKRLKAVRVFPAEGGYIYDFGKNTAGVPVLHIDGEAGQEIKLICGELLENNDLTTQNIQTQARKSIMTGDIQTIRYTCKGEKSETYQPMFSYYGCRYVKVEGVKENQVTENLVVFSEQSSRMKRLGRFSCSDIYADKTFECTVRSDYSNFFYFPTDCPHREKNGWTGDAYLSADQMLMIMDCGNPLREWLKEIRKSMRADGRIPCIVPATDWAYDFRCGPSWDGVIIALTYSLWQYSGEIEILRENGEAIAKYLYALSNERNENGLIAYGLGDWCQIGSFTETVSDTPTEVTATLNAMDCCRKADKIFSVLGDDANAAFARSLYQEFRQALRKHHLETDRSKRYYLRMNCGTQTAQAMALYYGLFEKEEELLAAQRLRELIAGNEDRMRVGVLGARVLLRALSDYGMADLAYEIAMSTDRPSYGTMIDHGATTLFEFIHTFKTGGKPLEVTVNKIKSMNHHFWGDIAAWYMQYLAGIRFNEKTDDVFCVDISPCFVSRLDYVSSSFESLHGKIESMWNRCGKDVLLTIRIPENMHGELRLPAGWTCVQRALIKGLHTYKIIKE